MKHEETRVSRRPTGERPALQFSFEFFPPKTDEAEDRFWGSLHRLAPLQPRFVSVTYGAGGSTRERTLRLVSKITSETGIQAAAHVTCVGASRDEVNTVVRGYEEAGVKRIVALRGDPPAGVGTTFVPQADGYRNAAELVAGIRTLGEFDISVAAYPERHPESSNWQSDIDNLKRKIDAGADRAITQMFFDNAHYWRFLERARTAGITAPIVPGIQPIHNFTQVSNFASRCGSSVPHWVAERFAGLENDADTQALVAVALAAEQVTELVDGGVTDFHFYTMNRSNLVLALGRILGRRTSQDKTS